MSKIQKALKALKNSNKNAVSGAGTGDEPMSMRPDKKMVDRSHRSTSLSGVNHGQNVSVAFEKTDELLPRGRIDLSISDIELAGLSPREEDLDVIAQQFRRIKRPIIQLAFESDAPIGSNANVIMMASALPGAGKSFCSFNLAQSVSLERDIGAVLVDADVLKSGISRSFGLQDNVGLIDYLVDSSIQLEDILVQSNLNNIVVIPAGKQHAEATELLASRRMQELISMLSDSFKSRAVIFDTPPLLVTNEAQVLAANAGQIVMVIEARVSSQESVMRALGLLDPQKPINAILNKSRSAAGAGYRSDDYGYYPYSSAAFGNEGNV